MISANNMESDISDTSMCKWFNSNVKKLNNKLWLPTNNMINYSAPYEYHKTSNINFECKTNEKKVYTANLKFTALDVSKLETKVKNLNKKIKEIKLSDKNDEIKKNKINKLYGEYMKYLDHYDEVIKTDKIVLNIDPIQINIINGWANECTRVYNYCVKMYNSQPYNFDDNYQTLKLKIFKSLYGENDKGCPYDMLTDEVRCFCSNLKSCKSNMANGHINHYYMKYKITDKTQSLFIPKTAIRKYGIYPNSLGPLKQFTLPKEFANCDSRLFINKKLNQYYLCIPRYYKKLNIIQPNQIVALDLGERIPYVLYSENHYAKIGEDIRVPILKYQTSIRKYQSALSKNVNKNGERLKNRTQLKRKKQMTYNNIKNLVKELHNQTAIYLCENYKRIIIPEFKTQDMITNNPTNTRKSKLNKRVKFVLLMLSHYSFRQHLANKCAEYGCQLDVVTEEYTSQCCTKCGHLSQNYKGREKHCSHCNFEINRDVNGARNILLKNSKKHIKSTR